LAAILFSVACGSSGDDDGTNDAPADPDATGGDATGGDTTGDDATGPDVVTGPRPPGPRPTFPTLTPSLTGYTLVSAFSPAQVAAVPDPICVVWRKDRTAPPFVLGYAGSISMITAGGAKKVLDIHPIVSEVRESGMLGMALHPQFDDAADPHPYAYVWYNLAGTPQHQRLSRFTWSQSDLSFDPGSETILVDQLEQSPNHNGGRITFGKDGFLYFGNGDDENKANYQTISNGLFAGIFRIDVDMRGGSISHAPPRGPAAGSTANYFIPNDNPFVGVPSALEEFYALGLRNPYAFSFDTVTGDLWAADVGETFRE
jgi:glucose/arabinose dehydrogenase